MSGPVRLVDIAREVGVHPSVVSRTLSKDPRLNIRDETREQILETATRLGYRPNSAARQLKGATAGAIAVVMPSLRNPVWAEIVRGILSVAESRETAVLIVEVPDDSDDGGPYTRLVEEGRIDGLLIGTSGGARDAPRVPTVHVNRAASGAACNVVFDEEKSIGIALEHLRDAGHREVVIVDGPSGIDTTVRRRVAAEAFAEAHGLEVSFLNRPFSEEGGHGGVTALRNARAERLPSAIVVSSFTQVVGALAALREGGLRVPDDVSLICLDDDQLLDYLDMPVSSVRMPLFALGAEASRALFERISGRPTLNVEVSDPMFLVDRASVAAPRAALLDGR